MEETLKYALNTLAAFATTWFAGILTPEFYERYGQKVEHSKISKTAVEKKVKAIAIGKDGIYLLDAIWQSVTIGSPIYAENTPASIRNLRALEVLLQVWLQQYDGPTEDQVQLRTPGGTTGKVKKQMPSGIEESSLPKHERLLSISLIC